MGLWMAPNSGMGYSHTRSAAHRHASWGKGDRRAEGSCLDPFPILEGPKIKTKKKKKKKGKNP